MSSPDSGLKDDDGEKMNWLDHLQETMPDLQTPSPADYVSDALYMRQILDRLCEIMPQAIEIGRLREQGLRDTAIAGEIGIPHKTFTELPVLTSVGSFFISYLTYNPLKVRKRFEEEMITEKKDEIRRLDAILAEYDADTDFAENLVQDDEGKFREMKKMQRALVLSYCDYVRQRLREHLANPTAINAGYRLRDNQKLWIHICTECRWYSGCCPR